MELVPPKGPWVVGERATYRVTLRYESSLEVNVSQGGSLKSVLLRQVTDRKKPATSGLVDRELSYELTPIRFDVVELPTLTVVWRDHEAGTSGVVPVPLGRVEVQGKFASVAEAKLGDVPHGYVIRHKNMTLVVGVIAVSVTVVSILFTLLVLFFIRKFVLRATAPPTPPDETALGALDGLEANTELRERDPEAFIVQVSTVLRSYLGDRYSFEALEATTTELLVWADTQNAAGLSVLTLRQMLESMDMVKFARQGSGPERCLEQLRSVRELVGKTRETLEQRAARRMESEARIPSTSERVFSWSIDALMGASLCATLCLCAALTQSVWYLLAAGASWVLWVALKDVTQRSLGKRWAGLLLVRVGAAQEDLTESVPPVGHRILRNLTFAPFVSVVAEGIASSLIPQRRRLGDLIARTRVVRSKPGGKEIPASWNAALILVTASTIVLPLIWALVRIWGGGVR